MAQYPEDKAFLRSTCLVSSEWRFATLPHLYYKIKLSNTIADFERLVDTIASTPEIAQYYTREVTFTDFVPAKFDMGNPAEVLAMMQGLNEVPDVPLPPMPRVHALRYNSLDPTAGFRITRPMFQFLKTFGNLTHLTINAICHNVYNLEKFLWTCGPHLKYLKLEDFAFAATALPTRPPSPLCNLKELESFIIEDTDDPLDWLVERLFLLPLTAPKSLKSLLVKGGAEPMSERGFANLVDRYAQSIESLGFFSDYHEIVSKSALFLYRICALSNNRLQ
jgi:hypothetical protein